MLLLQHVDNYEYELPSDFEDEEIDEEMAFTAEDKKLYAGWFGDEEDDQQQEDEDGPGSSSEDDGGGARRRRSKRSKGLGEFADLESSSDEEQQEGEDGYDDDEVCKGGRGLQGVCGLGVWPVRCGWVCMGERGSSRGGVGCETTSHCVCDAWGAADMGQQLQQRSMSCCQGHVCLTLHSPRSLVLGTEGGGVQQSIKAEGLLTT